MSFRQSLTFGQAGESDIARWLKQKGCSVLPVYEKILDTGKGPQLFLPDGCLIAPDMLVFKDDKTLWIEAKHKTAFTWHWKTSCWTTGIDLRHYLDYLKVDDFSPWPVWLLFLHRGGQAKNSLSGPSPAGLFGNTLEVLRRCENHRHNGWADGMVYWRRDSLKLLATLETVIGSNDKQVGYGDRHPLGGKKIEEPG